MKKTIFIAGLIVLSCVVLDYEHKDVLFLLALSVILMRYWHDHTRPNEADPYKGWKLLQKLEAKIGAKEVDDEHIRHLLDNYTLRNLHHLTRGIRQRISEWKMGGMVPMGLREEALTDRRIKYYQHLYQLVTTCLAEKEKQSIFCHPNEK